MDAQNAATVLERGQAQLSSCALTGMLAFSCEREGGVLELHRCFNSRWIKHPSLLSAEEQARVEAEAAEQPPEGVPWTKGSFEEVKGRPANGECVEVQHLGNTIHKLFAAIRMQLDMGWYSTQQELLV